jgi:hypothetical protein
VPTLQSPRIAYRYTSNKKIQMLLLSSLPFNAPAPNTPLVIQTCSTCSPITLGSDTPPTKPPVAQSTGASIPPQQIPELQATISLLDLPSSSGLMINDEFPSAILSFSTPESTKPAVSQPLNGGYPSMSGIALPSSTGVIASPTHHAGVSVLRCSLVFLALGILTPVLVLWNI